MKTFWLSLSILLALAAPAFALEQPAWRASASATGKNASVNLDVQVGDVVMLYMVSNNHSLSSLNSETAGEGSFTWWSYGGHVWKHASGKYGELNVFVKGTQITTAGTLTITTNCGGCSTSAIIAVAISGLTLVNLAPDQIGCQCHTVRQQKNNGQDINSPDAPIMPGATPSVPLLAQTTPYLSTSLLLAVFTNESAPNGVTAPSGWTQEAEAHVTASGKSVSLSIVGVTGVTDYLTTWGSTTATRGNASTLEIQPLQ